MLVKDTRFSLFSQTVYRPLSCIVFVESAVVRVCFCLTINKSTVIFRSELRLYYNIRALLLGNSVTVARLTLDQLVKVRILVPQFDVRPFLTDSYIHECFRGHSFKTRFYCNIQLES